MRNNPVQVRSEGSFDWVGGTLENAPLSAIGDARADVTSPSATLRARIRLVTGAAVNFSALGRGAGTGGTAFNNTEFSDIPGDMMTVGEGSNVTLATSQSRASTLARPQGHDRRQGARRGDHAPRWRARRDPDRHQPGHDAGASSRGSVRWHATERHRAALRGARSRQRGRDLRARGRSLQSDQRRSGDADARGSHLVGQKLCLNLDVFVGIITVTVASAFRISRRATRPSHSGQQGRTWSFRVCALRVRSAGAWSATTALFWCNTQAINALINDLQALGLVL
jgi:hypothetical protein